MQPTATTVLKHATHGDVDGLKDDASLIAHQATNSAKALGRSTTRELRALVRAYPLSAVAVGVGVAVIGTIGLSAWLRD